MGCTPSLFRIESCYHPMLSQTLISRDPEHLQDPVHQLGTSGHTLDIPLSSRGREERPPKLVSSCHLAPRAALLGYPALQTLTQNSISAPGPLMPLPPELPRPQRWKGQRGPPGPCTNKPVPWLPCEGRRSDGPQVQRPRGQPQHPLLPSSTREGLRKALLEVMDGFLAESI